MSDIDDLLESAKPDYDAIENEGARKAAVAEFLSGYASSDDSMSTQAIVQLLKEKSKEQEADPALVTVVHKLSAQLADNLEESGIDFDTFKKTQLETNAKIEAFAVSYGVDMAAQGDWNKHKEATVKFFDFFEKMGQVADDKYDDLPTIVSVAKSVFPARTGNPLRKPSAGMKP